MDFSLLIAAVVSLISIALWIHGVRLVRQRQIPVDLDTSARARWGMIDVLVTGFIWMAAQVIARSLLQAANGATAATAPAPMETTDPLATAVGAAGSLAGVCFASLWLAVRYGHFPREFGLSREQWRAGVAWGLPGFLMWTPLVWGVHAILSEWIPYEHPTIRALEDNRTLAVVASNWFAAVVAAPVAEEFLFRGVLQGWLQRIGRWKGPLELHSLLFGRPRVSGSIRELESVETTPRRIHWPAIIITSLLFGLAHRSQGAAPVALFVFSIGLGWLYQRSGSLLACIVMHMALNLVTMMVITLSF